MFHLIVCVVMHPTFLLLQICQFDWILQHLLLPSYNCLRTLSCKSKKNACGSYIVVFGSEGFLQSPVNQYILNHRILVWKLVWKFMCLLNCLPRFIEIIITFMVYNIRLFMMWSFSLLHNIIFVSIFIFVISVFAGEDDKSSQLNWC